jgi:DNA-binding NarL/FixJ family response regulator
MQMARPLRVALVNDYQVIVEGLARMMLPFADRVEIVERVANEIPHEQVDIVLYDTFARREGGLEQLVGVLSQHRTPLLVFYSWGLQPDLVTAVVSGRADGHLGKRLRAEQLVDALERVYAGDTVVAMGDPQDLGDPGDWPGRLEGLTEREAEIIALIAQGLSNREIAQCAFLSINTVKSYIRSSYQKMGVISRSHAVLWGIEHGFVLEHAQPRWPSGNGGPRGLNH